MHSNYSDRRFPQRGRVLACMALTCLLASSRMASAQPRATAVSIQAAIHKGRENLLPRLRGQVASARDYPTGRIALSLAAVLKAGAPHNHPTVQQALKKLESLPSNKTYSVACYLFALDAYWQSRYKASVRHASSRKGNTAVGAPLSRTPEPGPIRSKMEELVAWLVRGRGGTWNYGGRGSGDHSNTQFAILGLDVGLQNGISIPVEVFRAIAQHFVATHVESTESEEFTITYKTPAWEGITTGVTRRTSYRSYLGQWGYSGRSSLRQTMTAAGVSSLLVARRALRRAGEYTGDLAWQADRKIEGGLGWIASNWGSYVGGYNWVYYGLYSVEKVGDIGEIRAFGSIDWYYEGATFLLARQKPDGGWGDEANTAFALLFLTRATRSHLQTMGPPVQFTRVEGGSEAEEETDLVYIDKVKGFVSTSAIFDFLTETRDPKLFPVAEEAIKACPPHRAHDVLARVLTLWTEPPDGISRFASKMAAKVAGVKSNNREDYVQLVQDFRRVREMERRGAASPAEVETLLKGTKSDDLKRRLLDLIYRLGLVDTFGGVIETLLDRDAGIRRRAHEVLKVWSGLDYPLVQAEGTKKPGSGALHEAAQPWRVWWEQEGERFRVSRKAGILVDRLKSASSSEDVEKSLKSLVKLGPSAARPILDAMQESAFRPELVKALEAITGESVGIRPSDWKDIVARLESP